MLAPAKPELVHYLSENPGAVIEEAARLHAVTAREVVEALPAEMRCFAPADAFIAMNRFRVKLGSEAAFEHVWLNRDSQLQKVPGFVEFHLLKGPQGEDHTLYASHTVWQSKSAFEDWTKSEAFRVAHARAGNDTTGPLYLEHPKFEGFEVKQTVTRPKTAAA